CTRSRGIVIIGYW
nr:immunoglobulin heavy chain junction region [Macaca mulatta]MOW33060.1 immunoglobulin heavy chain junction region [Macaca mulatta]